MPALRKKSFAELAAERRQLYDSFNGREVDDEKVDEPELKKIFAVQAKLVNVYSKSAANKRLGNLILMEDKPSSWDSFQQKLFLRMQQFA
jgi:hypothetical protein